MLLTRRNLVAGTLALGLLPAVRAAPAADAELRVVLDALLRDAKGSAADRLAALKSFRATDLSPSAALDLQVVRDGAAIDMRLVDADSTQRFALQLERDLGVSIAPGHAMNWLERDARRLHRRADKLLRKLRFTHGTVGARFLALADDPRWRFANDEQGRTAAVAYMNECVQRARTLLPREFADLPAWLLQVRVQPLSPAEQAAGTQGYRILPTHGTAGAYVVDLRDMMRRPRWSLPSVVHHELLPGHLLQMPLEAMSGAHALRLRYLRAFSENWAVYAEESVAALGVYRDDAASELGMLHWLLFRALRGIADIGINHFGWGHERALRRLQDDQGLAAYFAPFEPDVERIARDPGLRAAEALGWSWLRHARASSRHDVRAFHRIVLREGRQPLASLAQRLGIAPLPQNL